MRIVHDDAVEVHFGLRLHDRAADGWECYGSSEKAGTTRLSFIHFRDVCLWLQLLDQHCSEVQQFPGLVNTRIIKHSRLQPCHVVSNQNGPPQHHHVLSSCIAVQKKKKKKKNYLSFRSPIFMPCSCSDLSWCSCLLPCHRQFWPKPSRIHKRIGGGT